MNNDIKPSCKKNEAKLFIRLLQSLYVIFVFAAIVFPQDSLAAGDSRYALVWKHNSTRDVALRLIKNAIEDNGYSKYVRWSEYEARSYIVRFFIKILDVRGRVTGDYIVIEKCRGRIGNAVLARCKELLQKVFPNGETNY